MAVINHQHRYLFLAEKHCASRVLRDVLTQHPGSSHIAPHHGSYCEMMELCPVASDFTAFSVIRNPADILVTMHLTRSFRDFMWHMSHYPACIFFQHVHAADVVLRYETLEHDLNFLLRSLGAPEVTIPHKEEYVTGGKNAWPSYYEKRDIDFILGAFPEIEQWGYTDIIRQEWEQWQSQTADGISSS